jgi:hypothetical protein
MGDESVRSCRNGRGTLQDHLKTPPRRRPVRKTRPSGLSPSFPPNNLEKLPLPQLIIFLYEYTTTRSHSARVAAPALAHRLCRSICLRNAPCTPLILGIIDTIITITRVVSENPDTVRTARGRMESAAYITILEVTGVNPVSTKYSVQNAQYYKVFLTEFSL